MAHTYIFGQSGTGKSTELKTRILDAVHKGHGVFYLDPHGTDTDELLHYIPAKRRKDVYIFDPSREDVLAFNPLEDTGNIALSASILLDTIKEAWGYGGTATPVMDMYLFFGISALMEAKQTMIGLPYILKDRDYRTSLLKDIQDDVVRDFWMSFNNMTGKEQREQVSSTLNKALMLIADPRVRRTLALNRSSFQCSEVVKDKIFFARLPQGQLSIGRTKLLGSVLLSLMHQACLSRPLDVPYHFFLDECHLWAPSVVKEMLSGIRKFNVSLTCAHQFIDQLDPTYYAALTGNCSEQIVFRTSMDDALRLERTHGQNQLKANFDQIPDFTARQFPFSSKTPDLHVAPISRSPYPRSLNDIEANHRINLTVSREVADRAIADFMGKLGD
jgi:type IV secretory pathway TraG/TraD family ATPase VirD4